MDRIILNRRSRWALVAGAVLALSGCRTPSGPSHSQWVGQPGADKPMTPAQEADLQISMGRVAERRGELDEAMASYRSALQHDKNRADALGRLAVLHDKQGKFRESADLYRKALAARPGDPEIFCDLGYSFLLQRRWAEAEMNFKQAIALKPEFPRAHNNLAMVLAQDNRSDEALAEFAKGGSDPAQARRNLAFALATDQRWEAAKAEYRKSLELDPTSELARASLGELDTLMAARGPGRKSIAADSKLMKASATAPAKAIPTAMAAPKPKLQVTPRPAAPAPAPSAAPGLPSLPPLPQPSSRS